MGGYLGRPGSPPSSPAPARARAPERPPFPPPAPPLRQVRQVQHVGRAHSAPRQRPARRPPSGDPAGPAAGGVNEAWRRFPMKRPRHAIVGPLPSDWWESYFKRSVWSLRHPRAPRSPVTVRIAPPEPRGPPSARPAHAIHSAAPSPFKKPRDPCAKETVLRALRGCTKGSARWEEPSCPADWQGATRSPDPRPSAFRPLRRNGVLASFVPRPGPLKRSPDPRDSDHSGSRSPAARAQSGPPPRSGRNAIASSYSSSREPCEPWKRRVPGASLQDPEWPVRKKGKGHQSRSPGPPPPARSPAGSGSSEQQRQEAPQPPHSPGNPLSPSPPPRLGGADPEEDLASGQEVGLGWSNKAREVPARCDPGPWSTVRPPPSPGPPSAGTAPSQDTDPQLGSLAETREPPAALPPAAGRAVPEARSAQKELSPRPSQSEPFPGTSSDSKSTATVAPLPPATATTRPPSAAQAGRTTTPLEPPAVTPAPLTMQSMSFGMSSPVPLLPAPAPPGAASADPTPNPVSGLPAKSEIGDSFHSRRSVTASAPSPPGLPTPTFKPIFGSIGLLKTAPGVAPFSSEQTSGPATPAPTHLLHSLVKATTVVMSTTPASTSKDAPFIPPVDFRVVSVSGTVGHAYPIPSTCQALLFGASCTFRASFSQATSFIFPPHQRATIPTVHTVTIFSQVLSSAVQIAPSKSTANSRGLSSPLLARSQPALTSSISSVSSASGPGSRPPFPPSLGATLQSALGATDGQKQGPPQPPLGLSFSSSFSLGNSAMASPTPAPTPAGPAFTKSTQSTFGGLTPSASASTGPSGILPNFGSAPAGFPFGQTRATGFGVVTQTRPSGARGSVFGSTAPRPFAFGGLVTPMDCGEPGVSVTARDKSSSSGAFGTRALLRRATGAVTPFGKAWSQNTQGLAGQSTPFALGRTNISARKTMFGGLGMAPFAQSTPVPGPVKTSSGLGFGMSSPATQGSVGRGPFRPSAFSFSIGAKSKPPKIRGKEHSRRYHAHRK